MVCKTFDELEKVLKEKIEFAMITEVSDIVDEAILDHIQTDVYDVYDPMEYVRRYSDGGLGDKDNLYTSIKIDKNEISMETMNLVQGSKYHRVGERRKISKNYKKPIAELIEYGSNSPIDYEHPFDKDRAKPPFLSINGLRRPFMENTVEQLREDQWHVGALQVGLVKQGIEVRRN